MGKRLHVAKVYQVEWDNSTSCFNWQQDEVMHLLHVLGCEFDTENDDFEIKVSDYKDALSMLEYYIGKSLDPNFYDIDAIDKAIARLKCDAEEVYTLLERLTHNADGSDGWYHFSSF